MTDSFVSLPAGAGRSQTYPVAESNRRSQEEIEGQPLRVTVD